MKLEKPKPTATAAPDPDPQSGTRTSQGSRAMRELVAAYARGERPDEPVSERAAAPGLAMVSADARLVERVRGALGPAHALARHASLDALTARGIAHAGVIIDCRSFRDRTGFVASAKSAREALERADVLLLFAGPGERNALRSACPTAGAIVCSSRDVEDAELADLLATFVGTK